MSFFDLILIITIAGFALFGIWFGLVHTLGSLVGTVFGIFLATRLSLPLANWLASVTGWSGNFSKVIMFILAFLVINRLVGFIFYLVEKATSFFTRLPFISGLNRILGCIFGLFEGVVVIGITLYFINKFPLGPKFMSALAASKIAPLIIKSTSFLRPLIPQAIKLLQDSLEGIM